VRIVGEAVSFPYSQSAPELARIFIPDCDFAPQKMHPPRVIGRIKEEARDGPPLKLRFANAKEMID
jgi:hypothetical protein